jgi:hypothetical protein
MKRYVFIAVILTVLSLLLGICLEIYFEPDNPGSMLTRMGALIVIIGTLISLRDFDKVKLSEFMTKEQADQVNSLQGRLEGILQSKFLMLEWREQYLKKIWLYEANIIIIGTAVWGFGDLLYCAISRC